MLDENLIAKWLDEGTINSVQAEKMRADLVQYKKESGSKKQITAFSTIGAILVGIGAILFVASNWEKIGDTLKVLLLAGSTLGIHYTGYRFKYEESKYSRLGTALLLLSTLFFGASIFLIAQIYNVNANSSTLVLIWIFGIFPLIYGYKSASIAGLCALLFYIWIGLLYGETTGLSRSIRLWDLYLISGIALYFIGVLHGIKAELKQAEVPFKFMGLQAALLMLFIYTFDSGTYEVEKIIPVIYALLGILFLGVLQIKPFKSKFSDFQTNLGISVIAILMAGLTFIMGYNPQLKELYILLFNIIFLGFLTLLLYTGYSTENIRIINTAMFWFIPFIFARYFDFFWELLPRSLFFILGGIALLVIGMEMEKKRKELKAQFGGEEKWKPVL